MESIGVWNGALFLVDFLDISIIYHFKIDSRCSSGQPLIISILRFTSILYESQTTNEKIFKIASNSLGIRDIIHLIYLSFASFCLSAVNYLKRFQRKTVYHICVSLRGDKVYYILYNVQYNLLVKRCLLIETSNKQSTKCIYKYKRLDFLSSKITSDEEKKNSLNLSFFSFSDLFIFFL